MQQHKLNIVLCGTGTVGGTLLQQIAQQQQSLFRDRDILLNVVGIVDIFNIMTNSRGINLEDLKIKDNNLAAFREVFSKCPKSSLDTIHSEVLSLRDQLIHPLVFVDCTASYEIADLYQDFLDHNISVVCANKVAASGDLEKFKRLKTTAINNGVMYKYETNVGAGLPIIRTIDHLVSSGDKITKIEAVLSGTLNYIFTHLSKDCTFSQAVQKAKEAHFSEPDPRIDLSGIDVIRKLVILARESGYDVSQDDVEKHLFVPDEYFEGSLDDFWVKLPQLDSHFEELRKEVEAKNEHLRFVAKLDNGKCSVSLEKVDIMHPAYTLEGSNNILLIHTERYNPHPLIIQGYGAGAGVTAAGVFSDILYVAGV